MPLDVLVTQGAPFILLDQSLLAQPCGRLLAFQAFPGRHDITHQQGNGMRAHGLAFTDIRHFDQRLR